MIILWRHRSRDIWSLYKREFLKSLSFQKIAFRAIHALHSTIYLQSCSLNLHFGLDTSTSTLDHTLPHCVGLLPIMAMAMAEADLSRSPPVSPDILEQALMNLDDIMVADNLPPVPAPHYAAGWRCHHSDRSGRYFYFNVNRLESRWDLSLRGPEPNLGLDLSTKQAAPVVPERRSSSAPATPQPGVQLQRLSFPQTNPSVAATSATATRPSAPAAAVTTLSSSTSSTNATVAGSSAVLDADARNVSGLFHLGGKALRCCETLQGVNPMWISENITSVKIGRQTVYLLGKRG